ncbi:MAG TPA: hypothetical protein VKE74_20555 [Gemmataceae bacterium]|nr:hypothetical protein [Gemmataceae bacterium]
MPGHLAPRDGLFARTVNAADYRTVLAVLVDEAKPQGISASGREFRDLARLAAELRHASATRRTDSVLLGELRARLRRNDRRLDRLQAAVPATPPRRSPSAAGFAPPHGPSQR